MDDIIFGGCLCGAVEYSIKNEFRFLLFCHCRQCRQISSSAHASNLFSAPDSLTWIKGEALVKCFRHPSRSLAKAFCTVCGSGLPYVTRNGSTAIVPAGSLHSEPRVSKAAKVFLSEQTDWAPSNIKFEEFDRFPDYFADP
ncbi:MAG: GFA family protein [Pseudomonadota bacterium]